MACCDALLAGEARVGQCRHYSDGFAEVLRGSSNVVLLFWMVQPLRR